MQCLQRTEPALQCATYYYRFNQEVNEKKPEVPKTDPVTEERTYRAVKTLQGINNLEDATDPTNATFKIDLSKYENNTSIDDLEAFIADLFGKTLHYGSSSHSYTFTDSAARGKAFDQIPSTNAKIDLNSLRKSVGSGASIADAVCELFTLSALRNRLSKVVCRASRL